METIQLGNTRAIEVHSRGPVRDPAAETADPLPAPAPTRGGDVTDIGGHYHEVVKLHGDGHPDERVTTVHIRDLRTAENPDGRRTLREVLAELDDLWRYHSLEAHPPAWVAASRPALAAVVAEHFGAEIRDLVDEEPAK